ncbi:MAG: DEAD/DEAH box helicase [Succinivibrionaceae bacterium]|nr:DEAD/DEAH box helicase [Succinivibrionaceae bacterium]
MNVNAQTSAAGDEAEATSADFASLGLDERVFRAISDLGFESPSKIQEKSIPILLSGRDLIGQAQTGTGKTAAFALPLLSKIDVSRKGVQALILTPTRELAIQIAEACQTFAKYLEDFHILPVYGGAAYEPQIRALCRGVHIVVGTPGRVMDLMRREKLDLSSLKTLVLDEADEMLNMGFIEDIEWVISQCPAQRQTALFSATMPDAIRRVAVQYLTDPVEVRIAAKTSTASTVRQRFWYVSGLHKVDAMARLLEIEPYEAVLVFVRTKTDAEAVALKLAARGFSAEALHGDIPQKHREKIVDKLKTGRLDILVATDVAARGLDVDRITHVINYDIPYDVESYVHRIGRTGRAGRTGDAILFVSPMDRKMLRIIEQTTRQKIEPMLMPSNEDINRHRVDSFKKRILERLDEERNDLDDYREVVSELLADDSVDAVELCAVLARMANNDEPLVREAEAEPEQKRLGDDRVARPLSAQAEPLKDHPEIEMRRYRLSVGHCDGVKPGQIVGAIANEGNIDSSYIGHIDIYGTFSTVDLPVVPDDIGAILQNTRVCGRCLELREFTREPPERPSRGRQRPFADAFKTRDRGDAKRSRGKVRDARPAGAVRKRRGR